jgi:hypothetical protein
MTSGMSVESLKNGMNIIAGTARRTGRSVRGVARWSHNQRCPTNNAMFAARIDADRLLEGTAFSMEFGLSPFAIARGARVEQLGRANSYAVTVDLLRTHFGYGIDEVVPLDLRHGFPRNDRGMAARALRTRHAIEAGLKQRRDAPNMIDGAVLAARIGGHDAFLEADAVGAKNGPVFHVGEFKGWPVVDGRAEDPTKLGATKTQMGIYRYLLGDLIDALGGSIETVSAMGLLVTPKNVGLTLVGSPVDLTGPTRVAEATLANLPDPADFLGALPSGLDFGAVTAREGRPEDIRLEALAKIVGTLGTRYQESCLTSCPLTKFCRQRTFQAGDPAVAGLATTRFLPGVVSLRRAAELVDGAPAAGPEIATGAAGILAAAGELYRQKTIATAPSRVARIIGRRASA